MAKGSIAGGDEPFRARALAEPALQRTDNRPSRGGLPETRGAAGEPSTHRASPIRLQSRSHHAAGFTTSGVLVDTGAELSWIPATVLDPLGIERYEQRRFRQANGTVLERWTGHALIYVAGKRTADDVVFGEPGDLVLLGSRTLEGLNVRIEPVTKQLVDAGPAPAAAVLTP